LIFFLLTQYWRAWSVPFVGDDFVILDRVSGASFWDLWRTKGPMLFGWYRPVSRELHYWIMQRLAGNHETAFHLVSLALWVSILCLLHRYLHTLVGSRVAAIAVAGAACLSVWGGPLIWIAGVQDLWMLLFGLAYLLASLSRRPRLAALWLSLAVLSKESAAVFVAVAIAADVSVNRLDLRKALRNQIPSILVLAGWALIHPTLFARVSGRYASSAETSPRPGLGWMVSRTLLAVFDLDTWPSPESGWGGAFLLGAVAAIPLLVILLPEWRRMEAARPSRERRWRFAGVWSAIGVAVALGPSLGWHVYYAIIGLLGIWMGLAMFLSQHRRTAIAVIVLMGFLRAARADSPSWDWGTEWYQVRAGNILRSFRDELLSRHPSVPPHARIYFTHVPNNIGLIAGDSPAPRIWYPDSTLQAHFLRDYVVRDPSESRGPDYFFYFDSLRGLEELEPATSGVRREGLSPEWEARYYNLATVLLLGGDLDGAASEYLALARGDPRRTDCAMFAAAIFERVGRAKERDDALRSARASGMSEAETARQLSLLMSHFPRIRRAPAARPEVLESGGSRP